MAPPVSRTSTSPPCFSGYALVMSSSISNFMTSINRCRSGSRSSLKFCSVTAAFDKRRGDVVLDAHLRLQDMFERPAVVAAWIEGAGTRHPHRDGGDALRRGFVLAGNRKRRLAGGLREVTGGHRLVIDGQYFRRGPGTARPSSAAERFPSAANIPASPSSAEGDANAPSSARHTAVTASRAA